MTALINVLLLSLSVSAQTAESDSSIASYANGRVAVLAGADPKIKNLVALDGYLLERALEAARRRGKKSAREELSARILSLRGRARESRMIGLWYQLESASTGADYLVVSRELDLVEAGLGR